MIYKELLGFEQLHYTTDEAQFDKAENFIKINYSKLPKRNAINIPEISNLIWEKDIKVQEIELEWEGSPLAFRMKETLGGFQYDFDLYAFCFYLVSRYEEYLPFEADKHGRFPATASLAYKKGFLQMPVVNLWVEKLRSILEEQFPKYKIPPKRAFSYQPSYDIDYAWMYKHKGLKRQVGGLARDLLKGAFTKISQRLGVLYFQKVDPYFTFEYLDQLHTQYAHLQPIYFWLLGDHGPYDKNTNPELKVMQNLIQGHQQRYQVGIHPSYASNGKKGQLQKELDRLKNITNQKILRSRQHFLKLNFPSTYRALLNAGLKADYSMGYAGQLGFRASIAHSFYWYDLENEQQTDLRIHPFMFMDVTLKDYLKINKDEVLDEIKGIVEVTKAVGGELMTIWHNNSFCELEDWQGWRKVYEGILDYIS